MTRIDAKFGKDLKKYGANDFNACYNCGTCTAVCSLSTTEDSFPREMVRLSSIGSQNEIAKSLKPWLCYYCGECSTNCPKGAKPGELMMSLRRWLSAKYDWTGMAGLLYTSLANSIIALLVVAASVIAFANYLNYDEVQIMHFGHYFEMFAISGVFAIVLLPNIIRMWYFTVIQNNKKINLNGYSKQISVFLTHMFVQKRAKDCDDNQWRWFEHFVLVIGYLSLLFTTVFLNWFETENHFIIVMGYIQSALIFIITFDFVLSRIKKNKELNKNSHPSDWFFVIWLLLMGLTAFGVRLFIDLSILDSNFWLYLVHLIVLAQWALIIVPFGKWTHFLYRSFAMFFASLKSE